MSDKGWWGVDLDGTLAEYHGWKSDGSIGKPVPEMVERVKMWLRQGRRVKILTARVNPGGGPIAEISRQYNLITDWCIEHLGVAIPITYGKDMHMVALYDDRAVQVELNTGKLIGGEDQRNHAHTKQIEKIYEERWPIPSPVTMKQSVTSLTGTSGVAAVASEEKA